MRFCSFVTSATPEADRRDVTQEWFSYAAPGAGQAHDIDVTGPGDLSRAGFRRRS
jgi:hypothetical protein